MIFKTNSDAVANKISGGKDTECKKKRTLIYFEIQFIREHLSRAFDEYDQTNKNDNVSFLVFVCK